MEIRIIIIFLYCSVSYFFLTSFSFGTPLDYSTTGKNKLDDISKKIHEQKTEIEKVEQKEAQVIEKLDAIEKQLLQGNTDLDTLSRSIQALQAEINESRVKIDILKRDKTKKELYLSKRLNASYKYYGRGLFKILLSSPSYSAFVRQEKFLEDILKRDHELFKECQTALDTSKKYQDELTNKKQELLTVKNQMSQKRDAIKESLQEKTALLDKIKQEKSLQLNALRELENYSQELQSFVERLPQERETFTSSRYKFSMLKGKLRFPVQGGKIISSFGRKEHTELHTSTYQKGIEIESPVGAEIKAVYDGKVVYADWFKGYGFTMIIDHGENYFTLLAHASKLLKHVGDVVVEGETIALVGDTNSINGSCLYFEIRHHGKPQDPLSWLKHDVT